MKLQDPKVLTQSSGTLVPLLLQKISEPKQGIQLNAYKALEEYWLSCPSQVEKLVKDFGLYNSDNRIKQECLSFINNILEKNLSPSSFILLSKDIFTLQLNSDDSVRSLATHIISNYPQFTKDRSTNLLGSAIRKTNKLKPGFERLNPSENIENVNPFLIPEKNVFSITSTSPKRTPLNPISKNTNTPRSNKPNAPGFADFVKTLPGYKIDDLKSENVRSHHDLEYDLDETDDPFHGKETEFNWGKREKHIVHMRSIIRGNAPDVYSEALIGYLKTMQIGIGKAICSLRTTLSTNACQFVKEAAIILERKFDSVAEGYLVSLMKMTSVTKKISSQNANMTICAILANISYNSRVMSQILLASQDKNVQPRLYTATWIRIIILGHARLRSQIETTGGMEIIEKCVQKGLADANPNVRENMRSTFWSLYEIWNQIGETVLNNADSSVKKALERCRPKELKNEEKSTVPKAPNAVRRPGGRMDRNRARPQLRELIAQRRRQQPHPQPNAEISVPTKPLNELTTAAPSSINRRRGDIGTSVRSARKPILHPISRINNEMNKKSTIAETPSKPALSSASSFKPQLKKPENTQAKTPVIETIKPLTVAPKPKVKLLNLLQNSNTQLQVEGFSCLAQYLNMKELPGEYSHIETNSLPTPSTLLACSLELLPKNRESVKGLVDERHISSCSKQFSLNFTFCLLSILCCDDTRVLSFILETFSEFEVLSSLSKLLLEIGYPEKYETSNFSKLLTEEQNKEVFRYCLGWIKFMIDRYDIYFQQDISRYNDLSKNILQVWRYAELKELDSQMLPILSILYRESPNFFITVLNNSNSQTKSKLYERLGIKPLEKQTNELKSTEHIITANQGEQRTFSGPSNLNSELISQKAIKVDDDGASNKVIHSNILEMTTMRIPAASTQTTNEKLENITKQKESSMDLIENNEPDFDIVMSDTEMTWDNDVQDRTIIMSTLNEINDQNSVDFQYEELGLQFNFLGLDEGLDPELKLMEEPPAWNCSWYDLEMANQRFYAEPQSEDDFSFSNILHKLSGKELSEKEVRQIISFTNQAHDGHLSQLLDNLLLFTDFGSGEVNETWCKNGMLLMKHLFVQFPKLFFGLESRVWNILLGVMGHYSNTNQSSLVPYAVEEIVMEIIKIFSPLSVIQLCLESYYDINQEEEKADNFVVFILHVIERSLQALKNTRNKVITANELTFHLRPTFKLTNTSLSSKNTLVRRNGISLVVALHSIFKDNGSSEVESEILKGLSENQKSFILSYQSS